MPVSYGDGLKGPVLSAMSKAESTGEVAVRDALLMCVKGDKGVEREWWEAVCGVLVLCVVV